MARPKKAFSTRALPSAIAQAWGFWNPRSLDTLFRKEASINSATLISKSGIICRKFVFRKRSPICRRHDRGLKSASSSPSGSATARHEILNFTTAPKSTSAEVFAYFRANKIRLQDTDEEKIRARFQKAKDKLLPLESSLAFTDELIDQIV